MTTLSISSSHSAGSGCLFSLLACTPSSRNGQSGKINIITYLQAGSPGQASSQFQKRTADLVADAGLAVVVVDGLCRGTGATTTAPGAALFAVVGAVGVAFVGATVGFAAAETGEEGGLGGDGGGCVCHFEMWV